MTIDFSDFQKVDIRVGKIASVEDFPQARNPAYILHVDFGDNIGVRKSSAQITQNYTKDELIGKQVLAVVNFPEKQIGPIKSQVLVLGVPDQNGNVNLLTTDKDVPVGGRMS